MLGRLENEKLIIGLPSSAKLSTGQWVSNYNLLSAETLLAEGWKEIEEIKPELGENQHYVMVSFEEQADKITITYASEDIPHMPMIEELQTEIEVLDAEVVELTYQNILLELEVE